MSSELSPSIQHRHEIQPKRNSDALLGQEGVSQDPLSDALKQRIEEMTMDEALDDSVSSLPSNSAFDPQPLEKDLPEKAPASRPSPSKEGPVIDAGHVSTRSFARTVSQDISWGEDEETDPAWNFQKSPSDFEALNSFDRSSSFPPVPPSHNPIPNAGIVEEKGDNGDSFPKEGTTTWEEEIRDENPEATLPQTALATSDALPDGLERFEEGVPLVQPAERMDAFFGETPDNGGEEGDFFRSHEAQTTEPVQQAEPRLRRKSTSQVLESLQVSLSDKNGDDVGGENLSDTNPIDAGFSSKELPGAKGGKENETEDLAAIWEAAFGDDDEQLGASQTRNGVDMAGFLGDDDDDLLPDDDAGTDGSSAAQFDASPQVNGSQGLPQADYSIQPTTHTSVPINPYLSSHIAPSQLQSRYAPQQSVAAAYPSPSMGPSVFGPGLSGQQTNPGLPRAQSFADKAKGGYSSPYDLPTDLSRPRRKQAVPRNSGQQQQHAPQTAPPPRSSSANFGHPPPQPFSTWVPPTAIGADQKPIGQQVLHAVSQPALRSSSRNASFFEDLPVVSKPRQSSSSEKYTSQAEPPPPIATSGYGPPPVSANQYSPASQAPAMNRQLSSASFNAPPAHGLQIPERIDPYAQIGHTATESTVVSNSRYSPQPVQRPNSGGHTTARYAIAPSSTVSSMAQTTVALPHQPRTSSPLAFPYRQSSLGSSEGAPAQSNPKSSSPRPQSRDGLNNPTRNRYAPIKSTESAPPLPRSSSFAHPPVRSTSNYSAMTRGQSSLPTMLPDPILEPPRRSQTQSPSKNSIVLNANTPQVEPFPRPASVHDPTSPVSSTMPPFGMPPRPAQKTRTFSQNLNFKLPTDGRELDPLQRWKGCPIFTWGASGSLVTSFPKETPMMFHGQALMQRGLGEVKSRSVRDIVPLQDSISKFPGPLKAKGKKKDVIVWLNARIEELERQIPDFKRLPNTPDFHGEKLLLWRVVRLLVEHDGALQGTSVLDKLALSLIVPEFEPQYSNSQDDTPPQILPPDPVENTSTTSLGELKRLLLLGDREKAVWFAADHRLWAHAMLLASTLPGEIWKDVAHDFINKEVQNTGSDIESLAALYEVFAGNGIESVNKLVHPSARLGMQVITNAGKAPKDALEGLSKWRETLGLIVANRSADSGAALVSIGKLLSSYNRTDAAHICYLFGSTTSQFGAFDDPRSDFTLVGADQFQDPHSVPRDLDSILLTEVYEFALSLSPITTSLLTPHLQGFKLHHALVLAEHGYRMEAQNYCSAIASSLKSAPKVSAYFNPSLVFALDNLIEILHNGPKDGSSSWVSKPSMEKVSGAFSAKFYSFISGDDSDAASSGSVKGGADIGPFAKIAGSTPPLTRNPSDIDLYGTYNSAASPPYSGPQASQASQSRYAPFSMQQSSSVESNPYESPQMVNDEQSSLLSTQERTNSTSNYTPQVSQAPLTSPSFIGSSASPYTPASFTPDITSNVAPVQSSYSPSGLAREYDPNQEPSNLPPSPMDHQAASYEAPASYTPHLYTPYVPEADDDETVKEKGTKKKSFMDDDEAFSSTTPAPKSRAEKDREAEDNFRKAAEADAQGSKQQGEKKGWLSGWFGKKEAGLPNGPIRAKLGEESSFVYDPDLKKWVNKKTGAAPAASSATPPPPKGPPSRTVSGPPSTGGPPSRPPSSSTGLGGIQSTFPPRQDSAPNLGSLQSISGVNTPARSESPAGFPTLALPNLPGSGPSSRPGTGISNASDIDDLLGPAGSSRKSGTVKKSKKGRGYVDLMAK
ncbi:MAG: vesicle coat component [Vezdaea aestivalis]|nr:MAG: vesicle coat component [Vezdaea aestivalis]